jgi:hypothetical protein
MNYIKYFEGFFEIFILLSKSLYYNNTNSTDRNVLKLFQGNGKTCAQILGIKSKTFSHGRAVYINLKIFDLIFKNKNKWKNKQTKTPRYSL